VRVAIPVFMYHHINWHAEDLVTLTPRDFENHLRVLAEKKIQTLFLDELFDILTGKKEISRPAVVLTFDDGHLDNWVYAFPLLKKYGMKATIFVITSWIGSGVKRRCWDGGDFKNQELPEIPHHKEAKKRAGEGDRAVALQWEEAREMEASGLVDIQSHTHFHRDYFQGPEESRHLDLAKKEELAADLRQSKDLIEAHLEKKCRFLAWPWGKYDEPAVAVAQGAGFGGILTTEKGVNCPGSNPLRIKRIVAKSGDPAWFSTRIWIYSHCLVGGMYSRVVGKI
jgi:peptidoglycan/xylan/chitin deacetylase (PgdA/CDA1 family)